MNKFNLVILTILCFSLLNCAKRGNPEGGPKDESPPELINASPKENSTNFKEKRIRLFFDEYIKLKDFRKQLVVSPPIDKSYYSISPQSGASKYIQIDINETLPENTTFVYNFGQSVVDNNEGNILPYFKYVFSTGNYVDSLKIKGNVKSVYKRKPETFISTLLYPVDENFNDSIIYNSLPKYVGNTLDSTYFEVSNVKKGKYLLVAINDLNKNYKFDPRNEEIGFLESFIEIPSSDSLNIELFKEKPEFRSFRPFIETENRIGFGYIGDHREIQISLLEEKYNNSEYVLTKSRESDTLFYWHKNVGFDSLNFLVKSKKIEKVYSLRNKKSKKDSLILEPITSGFLNLNKKFTISSSIPLHKINQDNIEIVNNDSISVQFKSMIDSNKMDLIFDFEILPNDKYYLNLLPGAITDFLGSQNDTLSYSFRTKKRSDYGTIILNIDNRKTFPLIVQLTDLEEKVLAEKILLNSSDLCVFNNLEPAKYYMKVVIDSNSNNEWDPGIYLEKSKSERTYHFSEILDVRANWILREKMVLD